MSVKITYLMGLFAGMALLIGTVPFGAAITQDDITRTLEYPTTSYSESTVEFYEGQSDMVNAISEYLVLIENTVDLDQKKLLEDNLQTNLVPIMAEYGISLEEDSTVPEEDGRREKIVSKDRQSKASGGVLKEVHNVSVEMWAEWNCLLLKCSTQHITVPLNFGEQHTFHGKIDKSRTPVYDSDLEYHHKITNTDTKTLRKVLVENWGTFRDVSQYATVICANADFNTPKVVTFSYIRMGDSKDIRYCTADGLGVGDKLTSTVKISQYGR